MEDYQQRVIDEKEALDEKIEKLSTFIGSKLFETLNNDGQDILLQEQLSHMIAYSSVLEKRIELF